MIALIVTAVIGIAVLCVGYKYLTSLERMRWTHPPEEGVCEEDRDE